MAGPTEYQWVITSTNYDTNPLFFKTFLRFDGVDDYLNLPWMNLAGSPLGTTMIVAKNSVSSSRDVEYIIGEKTNTLPVSAYGLYTAYGLTLNTFMMSYGNIYVNSGFTTTASNCDVFSVTDNFSAITQYKNGVIANQFNYTRQTMTTTTLLIGASNHGGILGGFGLFNLYGLIITKSALTNAQRIKCERFLAQKAGVMI